MRYKIVQKRSGEVVVYEERVAYVTMSGAPARSASVLRGEALEEKSWERLPVMFLCWEDAHRYVQGLKQSARLDEVEREEIVNV